MLPTTIPGFERTVTGLNGPLVNVGRPAAARTWILTGPGPRRALVDIVTRATSDADAAALLTGARPAGAVRIPAPPGAVARRGEAMAFRRGRWVVTLTLSPAGDEGALVAAGVAQAALLPHPSAADLAVDSHSSGRGGTVTMLVGGLAVVGAAILSLGLVGARRRFRPRPATIPTALPPRPGTEPPWSTARAAEELGVSPRVVQRLVATGRLTPEREGRAFRFDPDQVRMLATYRKPPRPD